MKYIVILGDGMADQPLEMLGDQTPLEYAHTPNMDALAGMGMMGMVQNVPDGMAAGSDIANLSVLGYDPRCNYTGRSPLEALSVGVPMDLEDAVFRCNLVTLSEDGEYTHKILLDHSAGEISTQDADILMDAVRAAFDSDIIRFYTGTSYRHICLWKGGSVTDLEPPHDHLGQPIGAYLPGEPLLRRVMKQSFDILNNHPLNRQRAAEGRARANALWFWGAGTKPYMESFRSKTGLQGAMISGVDLLKGIAIATDMTVIPVEGATGGPDTNYEGKAEAALDALLQDGKDLVYVHVEAPDEMGHQGNVAGKVRSIEYLDQRLIGPIRECMDASGEVYRMLILPDHPTPICLRTHTADPVPFILYDSTRQRKAFAHYSEKEAALTGNIVPYGWDLMHMLLRM